jgi:hypothetical protein
MGARDPNDRKDSRRQRLLLRHRRGLSRSSTNASKILRRSRYFRGESLEVDDSDIGEYITQNYTHAHRALTRRIGKTGMTTHWSSDVLERIDFVANTGRH